jgi:signal transduction histidine kinase
VSCAAEEKHVCVTVDDDGPGVPEPQREAVFRLGVRGTGERPGSGIGLAVVKALAARCGGDVIAEDSPLGGARFTLRLRPWVTNLR